MLQIGVTEFQPSSAVERTAHLAGMQQADGDKREHSRDGSECDRINHANAEKQARPELLEPEGPQDGEPAGFLRIASLSLGFYKRRANCHRQLRPCF